MSKPQPKTTNVYASTGDALNDILGAAVADEPVPTARAAELAEEALRAGPIVPDLAGGVPTLAGSGGGDPELVGAAGGGPPATSPRESAEHVIELIFTLVPSGDWQPESEAEREELVRAVERVFEYRGWSLRLPPEAILIAVAGKYGRKRMAKPAVRSKVGPWLAKLPLLGKLMGAEPMPPEPPADAGGLGQLPRMTPPHDAR